MTSETFCWILRLGTGRFSLYPYVHELVKRHQAGVANSGLQLWSILCFELWLRRLPQWTHRPVLSQSV